MFDFIPLNKWENEASVHICLQVPSHESTYAYVFSGKFYQKMNFKSIASRTITFFGHLLPSGGSVHGA